MSHPNSNEINLVRCLKCGKIMECSRYDTSVLLNHVRDDHPEVYIIDTDTKQRRTDDGELKTSPSEQYKNSYAKRSSTNHEIKDCDCSDEDCLAEKCRPYRTEQHQQQHESYGNTEDEEKSEPPQHIENVDMTHYSVTSEILEKYPEIKETANSPHNPDAQVIYTRRYKVTTPSPVSPSVLQQPFQHTLYRTSIEKWRPVNGAIYCPKCGSHKRPLIKTKSEHFTSNEYMACCLLSCWPICFLPWIVPRQTNDHLYCANCKTFLGLYDRNTNSVKPNRLYFSNDEQVEKYWHHRVNVENKMLENESPPHMSTNDSAKSKTISSIVINGKEVPPETVARIQKYKKFGSLVGLDMDAFTSPSESAKSTRHDDVRQEVKSAAPSAAKGNKQKV